MNAYEIIEYISKSEKKTPVKLYVKENSPFPMTVVMTCANGANGYIASEPAFEYGSYEVHNRVFARGTAEDLAGTMVDMLKDLHQLDN